VLVYSTILLIVLPIVAPMAVPVAPITAVPLATVPVPIAAMDALVKEAPNKVDMAVPVPAAPNTPAAPNEAAITGAAITQHVPTIIPPTTVEAIRLLVITDSFFVYYLNRLA
jgi:hypothetical protein